MHNDCPGVVYRGGTHPVEKNSSKKCTFFVRQIVSINCPRLPRISPQLDHKNTTFSARFLQKPQQKHPSTTQEKITQKNKTATEKRQSLARFARLGEGDRLSAYERSSENRDLHQRSPSRHWPLLPGCQVW